MTELLPFPGNDIYKSVFTHSLHAIFIKLPSGQILETNTAATRMLGYEAGEFRRMSFYDLVIYPEGQAGDEHTPGAAPMAVTCISKTGQRIACWYSCNSFPDANGETRVFCMLADITGGWQASGQLLREKELSDTVINSLPGIFYLFNTNGHFIRWNHNLEEVSGYSAEEISKMHPLDFFDGEGKIVIEERIREVFQKGRSHAEAALLTKGGGLIPHYFNGVKIEFENQVCLIGMGIDITLRVKAEQVVKEKHNELQQLSAHLQHVREEERKYMAREVHEELGQLASAVKMDIDWLRLRLEGMDDAMRTRLDHAGATIGMLIDSVRRTAQSLRPSILDDFGLNEALKWHCSEFQDINGIRCLFTAGMDDEGLDIHTKTALFRVAQESLTNVLQHAQAKNVHVYTYQESGHFGLSISDDGNGFDTTQSKRAFGLIGLRERVAAIGGELEISSGIGKGTLVLLRVPRAPRQNGVAQGVTPDILQ